MTILDKSTFERKIKNKAPVAGTLPSVPENASTQGMRVQNRKITWFNSYKGSVTADRTLDVAKTDPREH